MRVFLAAALAAVLIVAVPALAYPPASLTSGQSSINVAGLDCGTSYEIRVREYRSGAWRDQQTYTKQTTACPTPTPSPSPSPSPTATPSPSPTSTPVATPTPTATPVPPPASSSFPDATTTGVPDGTVLHACATPISTPGVYDSCLFNNGLSVRAAGVTVTRSQINGQVTAPNDNFQGATIRDSTIDCGCPSLSDTSTPTAVMGSNFTLTRVDLSDSGHGLAPSDNVTVEDSWIHGLGGNTNAHKDGIYVGDGSNTVIRHNTIECNDGSLGGCTSAIGLLTDFSDVHHYTITGNLLNTNGSYCFYAAGGPGKPFGSHDITFTGNHFGRALNAKCGFYGPVTYWDMSAPGMVWSGNVWDDTGAPVDPAY